VAVAGLLGLHYALAARSLVLENPTIDEIAHLPAGVTYWERGTFRLYHHNPPLVKLAAALPVVLAKPQTAEIYSQQSWLGESPSQATVGHNFALFNATRYFELFDMARLVIPLFSILGGAFVYLWSSRLYGVWGGLLSLSLWVFCPNILAHGRLVTSDVAAASFAIASTYFFWRYLGSPGWKWAVLSGVFLGLAQLTKFSLLLLYGYWPLLWILRTVLDGRENLTRQGFLRDVGFGCSIVFISLFVINLGYGFEKSFQPLGSFEFCSASLTKPVPPGKVRPRSRNELLDRAWKHRENRFRGTFLERLPVPLPYHYVAGFDEQKIESEGLPLRWFDPSAPEDAITGYSVYLDGQMRKTGWWYYYLATLAYKVPEGTWILILASLALVVQRRGRSAWFDELAILVLPLGILFAMSFLTDINLGLRYILPIFPFLYVGAGRVAAWIADRAGQGKRIALAATGIAVALTVSASIAIHPHYLAYFNVLSGGPTHGSEHLIDSNLDWGQDLVGLRRWVDANRPGAKVGLVYFGQFNPHIFDLREEPFEWFLPPPRHGTLQPMYNSPALIGPRKLLTPGLYAISATMLRGLPWRIYDPGGPPQATWSAAWNAETGAYDYFQSLKPITSVGYSILIYELTVEDCDRLNRELGLAL
jgi:4-amino-4-deoxy-L-arabinose transferase-like glycosyltransferase